MTLIIHLSGVLGFWGIITKNVNEVDDVIMNCFKIWFTGGITVTLLSYAILSCAEYNEKTQLQIETACLETREGMMNTKLSIDYEMDDLLKLPGEELIPL